MKVLALDTSAKAFSVALMEDSLVRAEHPPTAGISASQELVPSIQRLLAQAGWQLRALDLIALPIGPGSFSGLRMGVVVAKSLAYACSLPVVGVNTLEVIANQAAADANALGITTVTAVIDAQRHELFVESFHVKSDVELIPTGTIAIVSNECWAQSADPDALYTGPGLKAFRGTTAETTTRFARQELWNCSAVSTANLGIKKYRANGPDDFWALQPNYGRPSAAEEQRIERGSLR